MKYLWCKYIFNNTFTLLLLEKLVRLNAISTLLLIKYFIPFLSKSLAYIDVWFLSLHSVACGGHFKFLNTSKDINAADMPACCDIIHKIPINTKCGSEKKKIILLEYLYGERGLIGDQDNSNTQRCPLLYNRQSYSTAKLLPLESSVNSWC